jgi:hypothetical protein
MFKQVKQVKQHAKQDTQVDAMTTIEQARLLAACKGPGPVAAPGSYSCCALTSSQVESAGSIAFVPQSAALDDK